jgi:hypothetical protein
MFTPEDQAAIIALVTPLLQRTLSDAVSVAGRSTLVPTWRPGTCVATSGTLATIVTDEPGATPIEAGVIGVMPTVGGRVMAVFIGDGAVFAFAMNVGTEQVPYTSAIGGWVLNNAVFESSFEQVTARLVHYRGSITVGSTTTFGSALNLRCPIPVDKEQWFFGGILNDTSAVIYTPCVWRLTAPNTVTPYALAAVTQMNNAGLTSTIPWTWATGDVVAWSFDYVPAV